MGDAAPNQDPQNGGTSTVLHAPLVIEFPFSRTTGPVIGAFFTGLRNKKVVGIKAADGRVICPPVEYDPVTAESLTEMVPVSDMGTIRSWTWVADPDHRQPLDKPFAWVMVQLDGADTTILHALDAADEANVAVGGRVQIRWNDERNGDLGDIACFAPVTEEG